MGAATRTKVLLQQSAKLRAEAASGLGAGAARPLCATHQRPAQSRVSSRNQIPGPNASRPCFAAISQRRSALITRRPHHVLGMTEPGRAGSHLHAERAARTE